MAEIRCSMCSEVNPDTRDECQFCGARIKPLTLPPTSMLDLPDWNKPVAAENTASASHAEDDDDWLRRLQGDAASIPSTSSVDAASDWLARLNAQDEPPAAPFESQPASDTGQADNWLSRLGASDTVDLSVPAASEQDGAVTDWLPQIRAEEETPAPSVEEAPKITTGLLRRARTGKLPPLPAAEPSIPAPTTSDQPAWLTPQSESDPDIPDWIKGSSNVPSALTPSADSALPDWLTELSIPITEPATAEDSLDWLSPSASDASKEAPPPNGLSEASAPAAEPATPESFPDWLSSSVPSQAPLPSSASSTNELEWLSSLTSESPVTSTDGINDWLNSAPASSPSSDSLDWMSSLTSPAASSPSADSLDWMSGAPPDLSSNVAVKGAADWLGSFDSKPKASPLKSDIGSGGEPDWLRGITAEPPVSSTPSSAALTLGPEDHNLLEGLPSWLEALRPTGLDAFPAASSPTADSGASLIPAFSDLSSLPTVSPPIVKGLSGANLPGWLKSMKPVDEHSPQADMGMDHEERAGPLAGMRGTLLAESVMTLAGTPGESVERLIVTEAQAKHAEIFARIIQEETEEVVPRVRKREQFTYAVDRLLIAVVMMALVIVPSVAGINVMKPPELFSKAGFDFYTYVDKQLSSTQIALVALDYDVGYSNELNPAVKAVVFHLVKRNVRVALVSSSPMGAVMAREILTQVVREVEIERGVTDTRFAEGYGKKYIHLGYIPGGVVGLQNFVLNPQETVTNDFVQGKSLWTDQTLLSDLKSGVGDFGLIVVAASSAETAQAWIEQVGTPTKAKLAAITSASSAPLIYPYYSNKQLIGVLTRLPDVIVYSRTVNRKLSMSDFSQGWPKYSVPESNSARVNGLWQGYALGSNGIAAILGIGALASAVMLFVIRRREREDATKAIVVAPRSKVAATDKPLLKKTGRSNGKAPATKKATTKVVKKKAVKKKK